MPLSFEAPGNRICASAPIRRRQDRLKKNGWQPIRRHRSPGFFLVSDDPASLHCGRRFTCIDRPDSEERLMDRRDAMWLLVFVVLGVGGLAVFLNFYAEAIPSASLDFKLSRDEVHQKAQGYLENHGIRSCRLRELPGVLQQPDAADFPGADAGPGGDQPAGQGMVVGLVLERAVVQAAAEGGTSGGAGSGRANCRILAPHPGIGRRREPYAGRRPGRLHPISCGIRRGTTWTPTS